MSKLSVIPSAARNLVCGPRIPRSFRSLGMTARFALGMTLLFAFPLAAQTPATIDPGMTRAQVVAKLGEPLSFRDFQSFTYLLYKNGCERKCGMNDLVVLDSGKVVDAVFRSPARHYTGTSSSPRMIPMADAKRDAKREVKRDAKADAKSAPIALPKKPTP
jgi:hypothetical protein